MTPFIYFGIFTITVFAAVHTFLTDHIKALLAVKVVTFQFRISLANYA